MSGPLFSIVTPVYNTPTDALRAMVSSVVTQTFDDWELILIDDCSPAQSVRDTLLELSKDEPRIRTQFLSENRGIVGASNAGLSMARGEFIALVDHDDLLEPHALDRVAACIGTDPLMDYVYTDEDKVDDAGEHYDRFDKPDWSPERLRGHMYTGHLSVLRRSIVEEVGGFRAGYDGSQDHDLVLRVTEKARHVGHIPEVLYHWRAIAGSAASDENAKPYAWEAGVRAVDDHLQRVGIDARAVRGRAPSHYTVDRVPDVVTPTSVVIPTRGSSGSVLGRERVFVVSAVESILKDTNHTDLEVVVVHDADTPDAVLRDLMAVARDRLTLVPFSEPFSFSRKCNVGFLAAGGQNIVFLNDDVEAISADPISHLIAPLKERTVGMTGGRLLYEDGTLQHGGHRYADGDFVHAYLHAPPGSTGTFSSLLVNREASGLTAACVAMRREVFEEVGGFSESLPLNYNDVDLCLKVRSRGYRLLWLHDVELYHYESKTRLNVVEEWEREFVERRWGRPVRDPYLP